MAVPILGEATSWQQLHAELARHGIGIRQAGKGGELYAGDDHVKLSNVDRRHSWPKLTKPDRLGSFEDPVGIELAAYEPKILDADKVRRWLKLRDRRQAISERIDARIAALMAARDAAINDAEAQIGAHRSDMQLFDGDARLARDIGAAWPRLRASAKTSIVEAFAARIDALRAMRNAANASNDVAYVDLDAIGSPEGGFAASWFAQSEETRKVDLPGFACERAGGVTRYWRRGDPLEHCPAMVDAGRVIWINQQSDEVVKAALTLAKAKFGTRLAVFGDAAYLEQCQRIAPDLDLEIRIISVDEAKLRARKAERRRSPRQAIEAVQQQLDGEARFRAWARVYRRATPTEHVQPSLEPLLRPHKMCDLMRGTPADAVHALDPDHTARRQRERENRLHLAHRGFDLRKTQKDEGLG